MSTNSKNRIGVDFDLICEECQTNSLIAYSPKDADGTRPNEIKFVCKGCGKMHKLSYHKGELVLEGLQFRFDLQKR